MLTTLWLLFLTLLSAGLEIILFLYLMGQKIRLRYFFLLLIFNLASNFIYNHSSWFIIKFWGEDIYYLLLSFLLSTKTKKPLKIKIFNGLFQQYGCMFKLHRLKAPVSGALSLRW